MTLTACGSQRRRHNATRYLATTYMVSMYYLVDTYPLPFRYRGDHVVTTLTAPCEGIMRITRRDRLEFAAERHESMDMSASEGDVRPRSAEVAAAAAVVASPAAAAEGEYVIGGVALCKEQLAELREIFTRFDRDQDGSITELELGLMLRSLGLKPEGYQLDSLLQRADTNSNGMIEFPEFVALVGPEFVKTDAFNDKELLIVFRAFDRDGNGFITAAELAHSMAKLGQVLSVKELWTMIREADSDGDGRISFPEFAAAMMSASKLDIPST